MYRLSGFFLLLILSAPFLIAQPLDNLKLQRYDVPSSVRALEVISDQYVWFAGSNGVYGYTKDGGQRWVMDSITDERVADLQFRSIAVTSTAVMILSVGNPALLYRSEDEGRTWNIVYQEDHEKVFYDAMTFWDDQHGIAMGDPTDECLSVILTTDGGASWDKVNCGRLPEAFTGEAAFAASNSNVAVYDNHAWLVTGGSKARVFRSDDRGNSWEVFDTPMVQGGAMTGIYSVHFYDDQRGIIFGGDWNDKARNSGNKAITIDGGRTWQLVSEGTEPGYRSCVRYLPKRNGQSIMAVGSPGLSLSTDGGVSWSELGYEGFYTLRLAPDGKTAWLAGKETIGKLTWE